MYVSMSEIDLVKILNLDRSLSPGEIDQLLDGLSQEIFFRLITEKISKLLNKKDFQNLREKYLTSDDTDALMNEIKTKWPGINIDLQFTVTSSEVKKEFMINYLNDLKEDFKNENINKNADMLIKELQKEQIDRDLCFSLKEEVVKNIIDINK
ncbi:MAG: hypothetical protein WCX78_00410 [Patescibacteria group bacterium]